MRLEIHDRPEIVRADLDARFADLVRGFGSRMRALFGDEDAQRRGLAFELSRQGQAGEPAAGDEDIDFAHASPSAVACRATASAAAFAAAASPR